MNLGFTPRLPSIGLSCLKVLLGHTHRRVNVYLARFLVRHDGRSWKIAEQEILEQERLEEEDEGEGSEGD